MCEKAAVPISPQCSYLLLTCYHELCGSRKGSSHPSLLHLGGGEGQEATGDSSKVTAQAGTGQRRGSGFL